MKLIPLTLGALATLAALPFGGALTQDEDAAGEIVEMLTDFHAAAAEGDADRYLGYMAPDGVFFGTDPAERWSREELEALVRPALEGGAKIVNVPVEQNVHVSADGDLAWFHERLEKPRYGEMRATGVLRRTDGGWEIVQFHLTLPIPNEAIQDVVKLVRAAKKKR